MSIIMKKRLLVFALAAFTMTANAQDQKADSISHHTKWFERLLKKNDNSQTNNANSSVKWYDRIKLSGYGMFQYQFEDKENNKHNYFNLRLLRLSLDGKISDFDWRIQMQGSSAKGPGEPTVMLVDLYIEGVKFNALRIKVGQFKRPFTFENPSHPITQGWYAYANVINALSGFGDRTGEKSSAGRDIGIQIQGDLFKNASGRYLFHYQGGVFNGEGINIWDKNQGKDFIGGFWVMPISGLRIGAFGWTGSRGGMIDPITGETVSIRKNRYAFSVEYDKNEYTFRAEYLHSQGWGAAGAGSNEIDYSKGDKADGWYVFGIVPVIKGKLHAKARYQCYRQSKCWNGYTDENGVYVGGAKTMYEVGLNYFFHKNVQLNVEYGRVNDRTIVNPDGHNYNFFDAQFDFRF